MGPMMHKQCCVYCGRHYRSLLRHLDKHHVHQPDVRAAMLKSQGSAHLPHLHASLPSSSSSSSFASGHNRNHREAVVIPAQQSPPPPPPPPSVSPTRKSPALTSPSPRKSPAPPPATTPPRKGGGVPVSVLKRSPPTPVTPPRKAGRKKKEKEELEVVEKMKEEFVEVLKQVEDETKVEEEDDENEEEGEEDDDDSAEDKSDLSSSRRPHMLPLLSSLSSLVLYLRRLQHSAFISLSRSPQSAEAWRLLCHSSLALLILYNRRRECEVSKLTISEYHARVTPQSSAPLSPGALTPLEASLSPFERLVLPHLPRVGVQGKRGRVQPLILPPHSEHCLELLLQTRAGVGVDPQNPFVFARPYHSPATPLRGTDLLRNLAKSSGTRHPRALTQTRVRRQVAILTQLLMLSEGEEDGQRGAAQQRLENFLQKEYHVTQSCAAIGQDPGLMGLIGRVVLCGERDGVLFRGMSLHHICLELDVMSGNSADSLSEESDGEQEKDKSESPSIMIKKSSSSNITRTPRLKKMSGSPFSPNRKRGSGQPKPELSDSDDAEPRSRTPRRRKKHRKLSSSAAANANANSNNSKRKLPHPLPHRPPGRPPSQPLPHSLPLCPPQPPAPSRPVFKCPAPAGVGGSTVNVSADKHHAHQPDVRSHVKIARLRPLASSPRFSPSSSSSSSFASGHNRNHREVVLYPRTTVPALLLLLLRFSNQKESCSQAPPKSPALLQPLRHPEREEVCVCRGAEEKPTHSGDSAQESRTQKKEKEELEVVEKMKEEFAEVLKQVEDETKVEEEDAPRTRKRERKMVTTVQRTRADLSSSRRPHMLPLLSPLLPGPVPAALQHRLSSLSRSPQSAEAWRLLCHSSLALILYNRHACEVSKLTISRTHARSPQSSAPLSPAPYTPRSLPFPLRETCPAPSPSSGRPGQTRKSAAPDSAPSLQHCLSFFYRLGQESGGSPEPACVRRRIHILPPPSERTGSAPKTWPNPAGPATEGA
ncbi:hypothetical protein AMELA_G00056000 [Ameiurus melas]|uniref:Uncharacterized protein n=1 Tax=Ameiurus melas TaxID=219545 RepID=A0A7J6B8N4_AMEME|nr:hypothetical protein AMELA_G00056000 [Ameiurus melas]